MSDHEAVYVFEYSDPGRAKTIADSVGREVGEIDDDRSGADLACEGSTVRITIRADDLVALRAATNTWLGLVDTAEGVTASDRA